MAHFKKHERYKLLGSDDLPEVMNVPVSGEVSFRQFVDPNPDFNPEPYRRDEYDHQEVIRHTRSRGEFVGDCLMDYIYCWLALGTAGRDCPTFESYLLAIIEIIDEYRHGEHGDLVEEDELEPLRAAHGRNFTLFYWGPVGRPWDGMPAETAGPMYAAAERCGAEGHHHPALRRDVYEYYRARICQEELRRRTVQGSGGSVTETQ